MTRKKKCNSERNKFRSSGGTSMSSACSWTPYSIPRELKNTLRNAKKNKNQAGVYLTPPSQNSHTVKSKVALYRWIRTESRWNKNLISLSSPDWSASLRLRLQRKTRPNALIGHLLLLLLVKIIIIIIIINHQSASSSPSSVAAAAVAVVVIVVVVVAV